jgi:hypothetical protein
VVWLEVLVLYIPCWFSIVTESEVSCRVILSDLSKGVQRCGSLLSVALPDRVGLVAVRMRIYLCLETQRKRVADQHHFTWRTILKGLDVRSSRLWRRGEGALWFGPLSLPCNSPRTCIEQGDECSPPSCCKGSEKPSHDATCSLWFLCRRLYARQRSQCYG